jgi:hypothetical protein
VCDATPQPNEAIVRLTSGPSSLWAHACGASLLPDSEPAHFITVFAECVRDAADALRVREDVVLACTLAHEIGHLLLGRGHGSMGLMQAQPRPIDWQRAAHDGLTFTSSEAQRLREALVERNAGRVPGGRLDSR